MIKMEEFDLQEWIKETFFIARERNLEINPFDEFPKYYEKHKKDLGSFFLQYKGIDYFENMMERYDYMINCVNADIENLIEKQKTNYK